MIVLKKAAALIDGLNELVGGITAWTALLLVVVVFTDVIMRYVFKTSYVFVQELEWHVFSFIFLIGAGYTLLRDGHVRVDIIYQRLGFRKRAWVNLIGVIFFALPGCFLVIFTTWKFTANSWSIMEGSPDPGGIPYRYLIKGAMPVGFGLLFLQALSLGLHSFLQLIGKEEYPEERTF
jgi:TRAP-type mannitol/chloroaromatic compound transport system permease small subunit